MAETLLIASRDPFSSTAVSRFYGLAAELRERGNDVTLLLVQNGVLPARPSAHSARLAQATGYQG